MSIPKIIHYCWFGGNPLPEMERDCIESWKKFCPDYEIIEWNESNVDLSPSPYAQMMFDLKKWAFVTDYVRYAVVYEYGGIYLDTDVKLVKSLDPLLEHQAFAGFEDAWSVASGLGFGAEPHDPIVGEMLVAFRDLPCYDENGSPKYVIQPALTTKVLVDHGLQLYHNVIQQVETFTIYPIEYFCPLDIRINKLRVTKNTYSIHLYSASWYTEAQKKQRKINTRRRKLERIIGKRLYRIWETIRFLLFEGGVRSVLRGKLSKFKK